MSVVLAQGTLSQTNGDLDVAVEGKGYLEVTLPSGGAAYTRDGALQRTADGLIVTAEGYQVAPGITISSTPARSRSTPMARFTPISPIRWTRSNWRTRP